MSSTAFSYKGKQIDISEDHPHATISVDERKFACHHHHADRGLDMWMCDEAYFASPDIRVLARHFADYGYMYDDPRRVIVDEAGQVVKPGAKKRAKSGGHGSGEGH